MGNFPGYATIGESLDTNQSGDREKKMVRGGEWENGRDRRKLNENKRKGKE